MAREATLTVSTAITIVRSLHQVSPKWGWLPNGVDKHTWERDDQYKCVDIGSSASFEGARPTETLPTALVEDVADRLKEIGVQCKSEN